MRSAPGSFPVAARSKPHFSLTGAAPVAPFSFSTGAGNLSPTRVARRRIVTSLTIMAINEWNIQARSNQCQRCGRGFEDKESFHTLLLDERSAFTRLDLCNGCWAADSKEPSRRQASLISHWQSTYRVPEPPPPEAIQHATAESLLKQLIEADEARHVGARYILAAMLERKRVLKVRDQLREGGVRRFVYEHALTGEVFTITDPDLRLDQLDAVHREVESLIHPPAAAPAQAPAETPPQPA
jgi:hypothetical protein